MSALGLRLVTAAVLVPLVVAAVLGLDTDRLRWVAAVVPLAAAWEWARLGGLKGRGAAAVYVAVTAVYLVILGIVEEHGAAVFVSAPVAVFWLTLTLGLMARRRVPINSSAVVSVPVMLAGPLLLGAAWVALVAVHRGAGGPELTLFVLALVWTADSAAYFTGRAFGRRKLAPAISPGKSIEGVLGALVATAALAAAFWSWRSPLFGLPGFLALSVLVAVVSVTGDLFESLIKRRRGVKDSGRILPGHGGVLDRIDSLNASVPLFHAGLVLWGSV